MRRTVKMKEEDLIPFVKDQIRKELPDKEIDERSIASLLKIRLHSINQQQIEKLFLPLYEVGERIEETVGLSPVLVEFAIDKEGKVIPLQVKGHEGASKISFKVPVLTRWGMHVTFVDFTQGFHIIPLA